MPYIVRKNWTKTILGDVKNEIEK